MIVSSLLRAGPVAWKIGPWFSTLLCFSTLPWVQTPGLWKEPLHHPWLWLHSPILRPSLFSDSSGFWIMSRLYFDFKSFLPPLQVFSLRLSSFSNPNSEISKHHFLFSNVQISLQGRHQAYCPYLWHSIQCLVDCMHWTKDEIDLSLSEIYLSTTPFPQSSSYPYVFIEILCNLRARSGRKTQKKKNHQA